MEGHESPWDCHGFMGSPWNRHGTAMGQPWECHGTDLGLPWDVLRRLSWLHGNPMGLSWGAIELPACTRILGRFPCLNVHRLG